MNPLAQLLTPIVIAEMREAIADGAVLASAEWLGAHHACLVAGQCSRSELDRAAKAGWVRKSHRGTAVVYSRRSIEAALAAGVWEKNSR